MDYRVIEKQEFQVVGKGLRVSTRNGENFRAIPQFWDEVLSDGTHEKLVGLAVKARELGDSILGICTDFAPDMSEFTYLIAAELPDGQAPDGLSVHTIPAHTWAVFEGKGAMPDAIQSVWSRIPNELSASGTHQQTPGPPIEIYPKGDPTSPDYAFEVCTPVCNK